ncbi:MAG: adenosylcobinamide-phosphate synthase CbiB [Porphyromonas sp.]|nr:adenosylcobinamide-phosphate synthase CbiB [Porphyromonas sp.]
MWQTYINEWGWVFGYVIAIIAFLPGWILDRVLGDPSTGHPIILFGSMIAWGEKRLNKGSFRFLKGLLYNLALMLLAFILPVGLLYLHYNITGTLWGAIGLYVHFSWFGVFYMLSGTTLEREVRMVFEAVDQSLDAGRKQVARIVGRDTGSLSEQEVRTAALETLSENLSDGVVAPMFWFLLLGLPGIVLYKMVNTQDSMIGYLNERYRAYGCFSAKVDDMLNYIPARLTALLMLAVTWRWDLLGFVRRYGRAHASPNSGYPESALAGILNCRFGGPHDYFGQEVYKPYIGETDRPLQSLDMQHAIRINRRVELSMGILVLLLSPWTWILILVALMG